MEMPFGKYKGLAVSLLPRDYLEWLRDHLTDVGRELRLAVLAALEPKSDEDALPTAHDPIYGDLEPLLLWSLAVHWGRKEALDVFETLMAADFLDEHLAWLYDHLRERKKEPWNWSIIPKENLRWFIENVAVHGAKLPAFAWNVSWMARKIKEAAVKRRKIVAALAVLKRARG